MTYIIANAVTTFPSGTIGIAEGSELNRGLGASSGFGSQARLTRLESLGSRVERKLKEFETFSAGWSFGDGVAFSSLVINEVRLLDQFATDAGFLLRDVFPGLSGEIALALYADHNYHEFTVNSNLLVDYLFEYKDDVMDEQSEISLVEAGRRIKSLGKKLWKSSGPLTSTITTTRLGRDSIAWHSSRAGHSQVFRLLDPSVQ